MAIDNVNQGTRLDYPPFDGAIVHQATGALMVRDGITIDEAVATLHETAESMGVDVADLAVSIIRSASGPSRRQ